MITFEKTIDREIWCSFEQTIVLDSTIIKELSHKIMPIIPGTERVYLNLKGIKTIQSDAILELKKLMADAMEHGSSVRYVSVPCELDDLIDYLSISSDG